MTSTERNVQKLADNVWVVLLSRVSMLALGPALTLIIYLGGHWLDNRLKEQVAATVQRTTARIQDEINAGRELSEQLADRVLTLENNTTRGRLDREKFQENTTRQLEGIMQSISALNATAAALRATMEAQQRLLERR